MFNFKYSSNPLTQATVGAAATVFIVGMMLLGFASFIYLIRELVGYIVAGLFVLAGISTIGFSIKLLIASKRIDDMTKPKDDYRENVQIHRGHDDSEQ
ncbi:MAG: hypothetical protein K9M75_12020 [Phycisphaerae bacterium]|nr:hypothetical protein [Phycisphaerae bacterium]